MYPRDRAGRPKGGVDIMFRGRLLFPTLAALVLAGAGLRAAALPANGPRGDKPMSEEMQRAEAAVHQELKKLKADFGNVKPVASDLLAKVFPDHLFYSVIYRRYPVAQAPPA